MTVPVVVEASSHRYCGHGVVMHCFGSGTQTWPGLQSLPAHADGAAEHLKLPEKSMSHEPPPHLEQLVIFWPSHVHTPHCSLALV